MWGAFTVGRRENTLVAVNRFPPWEFRWHLTMLSPPLLTRCAVISVMNHENIREELFWEKLLELRRQVGITDVLGNTFALAGISIDLAGLFTWFIWLYWYYSVSIASW